MEIVMTAETDNLRFTWQGGAYIEVRNKRHTEPHALINVWDYATDTPTIEPSFVGFRNRITEWLTEPEEETP